MLVFWDIFEGYEDVFFVLVENTVAYLELEMFRDIFGLIDIFCECFILTTDIFSN